MQDVTAEIADENRQDERAVRKSSKGNIALQHCYGQIGISAVAAALEATARKPQKPAPSRKDIPAVLRDGEAA